MKVYKFLIFFIFYASISQIKAQTSNFTAQDLVINLNKVFNWGDGKMYGRFIVEISQRENFFEFELLKKEHKGLYYFSNEKNNKRLLKILYNRFIPEVEIFNFQTSEKNIGREQSLYFDSILGSNFSPIDLSYYKYSDLYLPLVTSELQDKVRLSLAPINEYQYGKLVILYNKDSLNPERIEFYDTKNLLFKSFDLKYDMVKIRRNSIEEENYRLKRIIATNLNSGYNSVFEINLINYDLQFTDAAFRSK